MGGWDRHDNIFYSALFAAALALEVRV